MKNPQIKRAYATDEYTPFMIQELARCQKDPIYFMTNYIKVQHPTKGIIKFDLYDYQQRFVQCMHENRFVITLQPRQCGKCVHPKTTINTAELPTGIRKHILKFIDKKTYDSLFPTL
jgi:hypothetical protein